MTYPWELDPPQVGDLCWCIHHNPRHGKAPLEILDEPIENRVYYIRNLKPAREVETRLRALRKAHGPFSPEILQANTAWKQADAAWKQADAAWKQADAALEQAARKQENAAWKQARNVREQAIDENELMKLFRAECPDVPWGPEGLIFEVTA